MKRRAAAANMGGRRSGGEKTEVFSTGRRGGKGRGTLDTSGGIGCKKKNRM